MSIQFFWYPNCTTCRRAKTFLDAAGIGYRERDIKQENPSREELRILYAKSGLPLKKFFNTSGLLYKEMALKNIVPSLSEEEQLGLLASDGMLIKRPILAGKDFTAVGFDEVIWKSLLTMK